MTWDRAHLAIQYGATVRRKGDPKRILFASHGGIRALRDVRGRDPRSFVGGTWWGSIPPNCLGHTDWEIVHD